MKHYVITHQCLGHVSNWTLSPLNVSCKIWTYLNPSEKEMQSEEKGMNRFDNDIKVSLCTPEFKNSAIKTTFFLVLFGGSYKSGSATGKNV